MTKVSNEEQSNNANVMLCAVPPRKPFEIVITIEATSKKELYDALEKCVKEVKSGFGCGSSGGDYNHTNYMADYIETKDMTEERFWMEQEHFNKTERFKKRVLFCSHCHKWHKA